MKKFSLLLILLLCAALLVACGCKHENWKEADCENPKTCADCGETDGSAIGHIWVSADCENPKTCSACGKTEGEALGHYWGVADCEKPKTCSVCGKTEGEALGHNWQEATTETPETCSVCGKTQGDRIITDPRFTTNACKALFGEWVYAVAMDEEMLEMPGFTEVFYLDYKVSFSKDGKMQITTKIQDPTGFKQAVRQYMIDAIYEQSGVSKEEADANMKSAFGMDVPGYVDYYLSTVDVVAAFDMELNFVYYVDGNRLYSGGTWNEMSYEVFSIENGMLKVEGFAETLGIEEALFQKVTAPTVKI